MRVIINADDLGKSSEVNEAIGSALDAGLITSSTVLANSTTWDDIHMIVTENPQASFGIHLNLTEGCALTNNPIFSQFGIVDENNVFTGKARNLPSYPIELLDAIKNEWDAQLTKVIIEEGISVSHIDGHHHIHTFYPFRYVLVDLLKKYGITKIRNRYKYPNTVIKNIANAVCQAMSISDMVFSTFERKKNNKGLFSMVCSSMENARWRKFLSQYVLMPEYFDSYEHFIDRVKLLNSNKSATIELMCHPGHSLYEKEMTMIRDFAISCLRQEIKYINYNEI